MPKLTPYRPARQYPAYVYLMVDKEAHKRHVKIGMSKNPQRRLKQLQTGNPNRIYQLHALWCHNSGAARAVERFFHEKYAGLRIPGTEWFDFSDVSSGSVFNRHVITNDAWKDLEQRFLIAEIAHPPTFVDVSSKPSRDGNFDPMEAYIKDERRREWRRKTPAFGVLPPLPQHIFGASATRRARPDERG